MSFNDYKKDLIEKLFLSLIGEHICCKILELDEEYVEEIKKNKEYTKLFILLFFPYHESLEDLNIIHCKKNTDSSRYFESPIDLKTFSKFLPKLV